jgi:hypothetical protein
MPKYPQRTLSFSVVFSTKVFYALLFSMHAIFIANLMLLALMALIILGIKEKL